MINLLNPSVVSDLKSARLNVRLRRAVLVCSLIALGVAGIYGGGFWFARQEYLDAEDRNNKAQAELRDYADVKKTAATYRANLIIAEKILTKEVTFSKLLTDTGAIMPQNTVLANLTLATTTTVSANSKPGALQLAARTKSYDDALRLKESLESSPLYSDVHLLQVAKPEKPADRGLEALYPFQATYNVILDTSVIGASS
ncbi:MAG: hypothetical protein ACM3MA_03145 [Acidobacteriota bacterium]